jgi:hypothetical protein
MRRHVWALVLLSGCGGATRTANVSAGASAEVDPVRLEQAGEGQRVALRYQYQAGRHESATMRMAMDIAMQLGEMPETEMTAPVARMRIESEVVQLEDGVAHLSFRYREAELEEGGTPALRTALADILPLLAEVRGTARVDTRGGVRDLSIEMPPSAPPTLTSMVESLRDGLRQLLSPLPLEPVGVGAVWSTDSPIRTEAVSFDQHTTYRLEAVQGERITLRVEVLQTGIPGTTTAADGTVVRQLSLSGQAAGRSSLNLGHILPETFESTTTVVSEAEVTVGQESGTMRLRLATRIGIAPR